MDLNGGNDDGKSCKLQQKRKINKMSLVTVEIDGEDVNDGVNEGKGDLDGELKTKKNENVHSRKQDWMFVVLLCICNLCFIFRKYCKNHALDFTRFESDPSKHDKKGYPRSEACKDENGATQLSCTRMNCWE